MAHVITTACIDCKDGACVQCCPVDCIYEGERTLYIHPDECIDCGICVSACPVQAIYEASRVPSELRHFIAINCEFFDAPVSAPDLFADPAGLAPPRRDHPGIALEAAPPVP